MTVTYLLMHVQLAENLSGVKQVGVVDDPVFVSSSFLFHIYSLYLAPLLHPRGVLKGWKVYRR